MKKKTSGIFSISNRFVAFAVLAVLVPSLSMGVMLYTMLYSTLAEKVEQKFIDSADIVEREISLWFKERNHDLTVFADSFILSENFDKYLEAGRDGSAGDVGPPLHVRIMQRYLETLQAEFDDYAHLFVLDRYGTIVVSSDEGSEKTIVNMVMPPHQASIPAQHLRGDLFFDKESGEPRMVLGVPLLRSSGGEYQGVLAVEVRLNGMLPLLSSALGREREYAVPASVSLLELKSGRQLLSTYKGRLIEGAVVEQAVNGTRQLREFTTFSGERMMGLLVPFVDFDWGLLLVCRYDDVFTRLVDSRNRNIFVICIFGILLGMAAYSLVRQIMVRLALLTEGARRVAAGDLDIRLPVQKDDEIGFTINVFNEMVATLKESQEQLELLATIDPLTSLVNRKQAMALLRDHFDYYRRYRTPLSVMMIDVDHFKQVNDTYGHQAGDEVLRQVSALFVKNLRNVDTAGRYGGEEFLVILPESSEDVALLAAERLRKAVEHHLCLFEGNTIRVRVSIGVSRIVDQDADQLAVVRRADMALYRAKEQGRNQVVYRPSDNGSGNGPGKIVPLPKSAQK